MVNFNNSFFQFLSQKVFNNPDYQKLYEASSQLQVRKEEGYVNLKFLDLQKDDDRALRYSETVYETIQHCLENDFKLRDICVLVRKKREGLAVSNYLSEQNIPIVSSETMLINASKNVQFINGLLKLLIQPENNEVKIKVLHFLVDKFNIKNPHVFFKNSLLFENFELFQSFLQYGITIHMQQWRIQPLYELVESIIRDFKLVLKSDAYVQFYLDVVLEYSQKHVADISGFLEYFEKNKVRLAIASPEGQDAVQIMTIHKSKGLEFPIVIFPFADLDIYREVEPQEWFPLDRNIYQGFSHTLLNYNKNFEFFGEAGNYIYNKHQSELELDNINLLYVALTRASIQLYVISKLDIDKKGTVNAKTYSGNLISYLQDQSEWNSDRLTYDYGNASNPQNNAQDSMSKVKEAEFISTTKESHNISIVTNSGLLWDSKQEQAIEKGNLIHGIMSYIKTGEDLPFAIQKYLDEGKIDKDQTKELTEVIEQIVSHPKLKMYFSNDYSIYNERDIISKDGKILRPDRLVISHTNEAIIIDYKTGLYNPKHGHQLQDYQDVLEDMGFKAATKILVYIDKHITIKEV